MGETAVGGTRLLARLAEALDTGEVTADDVERILARRRRPAPGRPTAASVLYALGAAVVFCGLAIAYGTVFDDLPRAARIVTPFAFPLVAFVACVALSRARAPRWQTDLAGLVGYVAFAGACVAAGHSSGWLDTSRETAAAVVLCALVAMALVTSVHRATRSARLLWAGMPAAMAAFGVAAAHLAGLWEDRPEGPARLGWVVLAEAAVAAWAVVAVARRDPPARLYPALWATIGGYAAIMFSGEDLGRFGVWHVVLAGVVIAAFLAAAALDLDPLTWVAAAGGAAWVVLLAVVVGSATGAALAVVLAGIGLAGLGLLVARLLRVGPRRAL